MTCPHCGTPNKNTDAACVACGLDLKPRTEVSSAQKIWQSNDEAPQPNPTVRKSGQPLRRMQRHQPQINIPETLLAMDDESNEVYMENLLEEHGKRTRSNQDKLSGVHDGETVRVVIPPEPAEVRRPKRRIRWKRFITTSLLIIILTSAFCYGGYWVIRKGTSWIGGMIESRHKANAPKDPMVEQLMIDGQTWHKITFYGNDGDRILVTNPNRSLAIHDGMAEILLDDTSYLPDQPVTDDAAIVVKVEAILFSSDGNETPLTVPTYTIDVPLSPLKVLSPAEKSFKTNETRVHIQVKVIPGSRVLIGENNVTDRVDASGYVTTSVEIKPGIVNKILISVETAKNRKNLYELTIERPPFDFLLELDKDTPYSTKDGAVRIKGKTIPGATITSDAKMNGTVLMNDQGDFSFTANLPVYGWNTVNITSTAPGGKTATIAYRINHTADLAGYTQKAWVFDYDALEGAAETMLGRVYVFTGTPTKKLPVEGRNMYLFNTGTDSIQLIVLEYDGTTDMHVDGYYKVYADVMGEYENYPFLTARFVYTATKK